MFALVRFASSELTSFGSSSLARASHDPFEPPVECADILIHVLTQLYPPPTPLYQKWRKSPLLCADLSGAQQATGEPRSSANQVAGDDHASQYCSMEAALAEFREEELGQDAEEDVDFVMEIGTTRPSSVIRDAS